MSRQLNSQLERIKDSFQRLDEGLYEYRAEGIKEIFKVEILDTDPDEPDVTIRIVATIYKNEEGNPVVFHLPISEISPEFDLKNALVSHLVGTLKEFKESLVNTPIDKPGIQDYLILKLLFLLDQPGICYLFLKNRKEFREYILTDDPEMNAKLINILSHNIGGFLKNETVRSLFGEMGRKEELDKWYGWLAKAKLDFLLRNRRRLPAEKSREDLLLLKQWFSERYDIWNNWKCLQLGSCRRRILFAASLFTVLGFFMISSLDPRLLKIAFLRGISFRSIEIRYASLVPLSFLPIILLSVLRKSIKDWVNPLEVLMPRLFIGVLVGSIFLFGFEDILWKAVLESEVNLVAISIGILSLIVLYLHSRIGKERIEPDFLKKLLLIFVLIFWIAFLGVLCVFLLSVSVGRGFVHKIEGNYEICSQLLHFWVVFSMFGGLFMQLLWQKEKITEPI